MSPVRGPAYSPTHHIQPLTFDSPDIAIISTENHDSLNRLLLLIRYLAGKQWKWSHMWFCNFFKAACETTLFIYFLYCISLRPQPAGVQCPLTSSLGELPGYWGWGWYPGLPPVLVSITFAVHMDHILVFFHSFFFTCHWISFVFILYDRCIRTHLVNPSLTHFLGEFPGVGLALVLHILFPKA